MALIEVLRCADCGKLSISVGDTRLTTEDRKEKGHGDRKCSGRWTVAAGRVGDNVP